MQVVSAGSTEINPFLKGYIKMVVALLCDLAVFWKGGMRREGIKNVKIQDTALLIL